MSAPDSLELALAIKRAVKQPRLETACFALEGFNGLRPSHMIDKFHFSHYSTTTATPPRLSGRFWQTDAGATLYGFVVNFKVQRCKYQYLIFVVVVAPQRLITKRACLQCLESASFDDWLNGHEHNTDIVQYPIRKPIKECVALISSVSE